MKKALFVVDERKLGGVSIVLENILNNISRKKIDISVLVLNNNGDRLINLPQGIKVIYGNPYFSTVDQSISSLIKSKNIFGMIKKAYVSMLMKNGNIEKYIKNIRKKMGLEKYDVEIAFKAGFCSLFVAYGDADKKLNWVHEDYKTYNKTKRYEKTFKKAFRAFDKHVIVSLQAKESFNDIYGMEEKTIVIENYIDTVGVIENSKLSSNLTIDKSKLNIVTLGRFCREKGFDRLIDAIHDLKAEEIEGVKKIKIYIIGTGNDEGLLKNRIKEYMLEEYIQVINGNELGNNPYSFMRLCDLYIMPSRSESFGMVRIEALLLGLPVITTNVANTEKMISNGHGIIVENTTNGIYNGLKQVIQNKELVEKLKENVKDYSYEEQNKRILNQLELLLEECCGQ